MQPRTQVGQTIFGPQKPKICLDSGNKSYPGEDVERLGGSKKVPCCKYSIPLPLLGHLIGANLWFENMLS